MNPQLSTRPELWSLSPKLQNLRFEGGAISSSVEGMLQNQTLQGFPASTQRLGYEGLTYRGTSIIINDVPIGPYSSPMPRDLCWS
jgi:hypothetical protein